VIVHGANRTHGRGIGQQASIQGNWRRARLFFSPCMYGIMTHHDVCHKEASMAEPLLVVSSRASMLGTIRAPAGDRSSQFLFGGPGSSLTAQLHHTLTYNDTVWCRRCTMYKPVLRLTNCQCRRSDGHGSCRVATAGQLVALECRLAAGSEGCQKSSRHHAWHAWGSCQTNSSRLGSREYPKFNEIRLMPGDTADACGQGTTLARVD
jgi:hypothetical protein